MLRTMKTIHKNSLLVRSMFLGVLLLGGFALQADRESERAMLERLVDEIEQLEPFIQSAEREHNEAVRIRFRYDWLRSDLKKVKTGIEAYLHETNHSPRTYRALQADYHQ